MTAFLDRIRRVVLAGSALVLAGCASVSVDQVTQNHLVTPTLPPRMIFVAPFQAPSSNFHLGERTGEAFDRTRAKIVSDLADRMVVQLRQYAAPAQRLYSANQVGPGTWIVAGTFRNVDQGSRALRAGIGFGAGESNVRTTVSLYAMAASGQLVPLLIFDTEGGSGKGPGTVLGVATGAGAISLATSAATGILPGLSDDLDRTAYETAAVVSHYLSLHGLLDPSRKAIQPKYRGKLPTTVDPNRAIPAPLRSLVGGAS